ncbi:hypothetical protein AB0C84_43860 [Actinomadura sp. NPDC048955]|uniref:hypothetical protein n=1 Tax=Actinomadura sp. NPDC048955 TaxID=3158228 RepID=UPI0033D9721B
MAYTSLRGRTATKDDRAFPLGDEEADRPIEPEADIHKAMSELDLEGRPAWFDDLIDDSVETVPPSKP